MKNGLNTREVVTELDTDGMTIRYSVEPVMPSSEYEGRVVLNITIANNKKSLSIGPVEIIEDGSRCHILQTVEGFTEFENSTLGFVTQLQQEVPWKDVISLYPCRLPHKPVVDVQAVSDHCTTYHPIRYALSSSYYLFHIPTIPPGDYNLRLFLNGEYMNTLHCVVRASLQIVAFSQLSDQLYVGEEATLRFSVIDINNQPFTDTSSSYIQVLVVNEGVSLDITSSVYQDQMEIRFTPVMCSKKNTYVMICINDCLKESLSVGVRVLSHPYM